MNSKSEVTVRTVVILIPRPFCFFVFEVKVEVEGWFVEHSTESSTWTGWFPPEEVKLASVTLREYSGKSLAAAKTSKPKGDRRFSSYNPALSRGTYNLGSDFTVSSLNGSCWTNFLRELIPASASTWVYKDNQYLQEAPKNSHTFKLRKKWVLQYPSNFHQNFDLRFLSNLVYLPQDDRSVFPCLCWQASESRDI